MQAVEWSHPFDTGPRVDVFDDPIPAIEHRLDARRRLSTLLLLEQVRRLRRREQHRDG
jgi:hypothetical protein